MPTIVMVSKLAYSDAYRKLVESGGAITREYWRSQEYRDQHDYSEHVRIHVVAITARDLELPEGTTIGTCGTGWFVHVLVLVKKYESFATADDHWTPSQPDMLALDWEWHPPRRST